MTHLWLAQGGTFTFVTPTLALLALDRWSRPCTVLYCTGLYCTVLDRWSRPCPDLEDDAAWAGVDEEARRELWQARRIV